MKAKHKAMISGVITNLLFIPFLITFCMALDDRIGWKNPIILFVLASIPNVILRFILTPEERHGLTAWGAEGFESRERWLKQSNSFMARCGQRAMNPDLATIVSILITILFIGVIIAKNHGFFE